MSILLPTPDVPIEPATTRPWLGSSSAEGLAGFAALNVETVGRPLEVMRVFASRFTPDPTPILAPLIDAGRIPVFSMKPPAVPSMYDEYRENIAALPGFVITTIDHEPENSMAVETFEARYVEYYEAMAGVANNWTGPCVMAATGTGLARAPWRLLLDRIPMDLLLADGYNYFGTRTFSTIFGWVAQKARLRGVPWGVAEWSVHGTDVQRSAHVTGARRFWELPANNDCLVVCWFNSDGGPQAGSSGWRMNRALPPGWVKVNNIAQAPPSGPPYVADTLTPEAFATAFDTPKRILALSRTVATAPFLGSIAPLHTPGSP